MNGLIIILPFLISSTLGLLLITFIDCRSRYFNLIDKLTLSFGIGLGLSSILTFLNFIFLAQLNMYFIFILHIIFISLLMACILKEKINIVSYMTDLSGLDVKDIIAAACILLASIPLWLKAGFYIHGGWDAWQVWNFKAKFLFLAGDHWKNMFDPVLWRSSPHYPLLLPCMTVWGWLFSGTTSYIIPQIIAIGFTFCTIFFLYSSLKKECSFTLSLLAPLCIISLPLFNLQAISQYSDITFSYFLLVSMILIIRSSQTRSLKIVFLAGLACGLMSFAKSEGFVSSLILCALIFPFLKSSSENKPFKNILLAFLGGYLLTAWSTLYFKIFLAPGNITFINGFLSPDHPSTILRFKEICRLWILEIGQPLTMIGGKKITLLNWNGIWIACVVGICIHWKNCINKKTGIIPVFLIMYFAIIAVYYQINTYFEIGWWISVTLNRILFAVLPLTIYWIIHTCASNKK